MNKKQLREEIIKCGKDPNYFIQNYVKIKHPKRGLISFDMFDYQESLVNDYVKHRFNVVLKARQLGISEVTASYAAWLMLFHRHKNVLVVATKAETAKNMIRKIRLVFKKIPRWLMLTDITTDNKTSIELDNGSICKAVASASDAGRSEALSLLIVDEAAFIKNMAELWTGLLPTVQAGGNVIMISTPNGVGNTFHKICTEAEKKINDFNYTLLMWWLHPERQEKLQSDVNRPGFKTSVWYKHETKNMSKRDIAQEIECDFLASGGTVLSADALKWIASITIDPFSIQHDDRGIYVWIEENNTSSYMITADVATGDGKDNSAFHIFDIETMEQCVEYKGKIPPDSFAKLCVDWGRKYNNALFVIESNAVGMACIEHIKLLNYESVYYSNKDNNRPGEIINTKFQPMNRDIRPGITTSSRTRPLMIAKLEEYIRNKTILIKSNRLLEELRTFIWKNGRPEAMTSYNDDLVMAAAFAVWIRDTFLKSTYISLRTYEEMLKNIGGTKRLNTDIPGACKDPQYVPYRSIGQLTQNNPYEIKMKNGEVIDIGWLIKTG